MVSFNTQPPEGGWVLLSARSNQALSFNTQPPEGGWLTVSDKYSIRRSVSTHSRLKAAGPDKDEAVIVDWFQHTAA